jgi:hypothetical protein
LFHLLSVWNHQNFHVNDKQPWAAFAGRNATWLAQFFIQQTDLTTFSEDGRGVKWLYVTNPNPHRNPNPNRINKKSKKKRF